MSEYVSKRDRSYSSTEHGKKNKQKSYYMNSNNHTYFDQREMVSVNLRNRSRSRRKRSTNNKVFNGGHNTHTHPSNQNHTQNRTYNQHRPVVAYDQYNRNNNTNDKQLYTTMTINNVYNYDGLRQNNTHSSVTSPPMQALTSPAARMTTSAMTGDVNMRGYPYPARTVPKRNCHHSFVGYH
eukprot:UN27999